MEERKRYIYKIQNKLDSNKFYIGTTFNVNTRWSQHKSNSNSKKLNIDIIKYGIDNFNIEIIFVGKENKVYSKEIELISILKPYYNNKNDKGGKNGGYVSGINCHNAKIVDEDVKDICNRVIINKEDRKEVLKSYPISRSQLNKILTGDAWEHVKRPIILKKDNNIGEKHHCSGLTDTIILDICNRIIIDNQNKEKIRVEYNISKSQITKILTGDIWKHVKRPLLQKKKRIKRLTNDEAKHIRELFHNGIKIHDIHKMKEYEDKNTQVINNVIKGITFKNAGGPIKP